MDFMACLLYTSAMRLTINIICWSVYVRKGRPSSATITNGVLSLLHLWDGPSVDVYKRQVYILSLLSIQSPLPKLLAAIVLQF